MPRAILSIAHQEHEDTLHKNGQSLLYFTAACACLQTRLYNSFGLFLRFHLPIFQPSLRFLIAIVFHWFQVDMNFMKKIPPGAEASNVLVGEVDFLEKPIIAFVRLSPAVLITGLTEVPVPTRYNRPQTHTVHCTEKLEAAVTHCVFFFFQGFFSCFWVLTGKDPSTMRSADPWLR